MRLQRLHEICAQKGYAFTYENDITTITADGDISFRIRSLPANIVFNNKGNVKLEILRRLPATTQFKNKKDVSIAPETIIPEEFKGFKNKGNIIPENYKYKVPKVKYQFSDELNYFIQENKANNKWVDKLAKLNNKYLKSKDKLQGSFIDCIDDISFMPVDKIHKSYQEAKQGGVRYAALDNYTNNSKYNLIKEGLKNTIKFGRFMKKLFADITDTEVEEVVNMFKAFKNSGDCGLEIVTGKDIVKYYNRANQETASSGRLYNSCMNYTAETDNRFTNLHFYANIPNCGLLILRSKDSEKIRGRALIWTTKDGQKYVDNIYVAKESDMFIYKKYIAVNKCLSYINNDSIKDVVIDCPKDLKTKGNIMPYLDTLRFDEKKHVIISQRA